MAPSHLPALFAALLVLGTGAARAAPRRVELPLPLSPSPRAAARTFTSRVLRPLPADPMDRPGVYARVTRWISDFASPGPDGKPKVVVVTVRGGLGLGWARRW